MSAQILALDSSTEACSVALLLNNVIDTSFEFCIGRQAQCIIPLIEKILTRHQLMLTQLNALAFGRGPGSFTGIRISIGVAQGLAFGANLPLLSVSTLMSMAEAAWQRYGSTHVLAAIDARMGEVYWAEYQRLKEGEWSGEESEAVLKPEAAILRMKRLSGEWITVGTGWKIFPNLIKESPLALSTSEIFFPMAESMLPLAKQLWIKGKAISPEKVKATYLRNEVMWKKLPGRL